jgi:hypothetical protein
MTGVGMHQRLLGVECNRSLQSNPSCAPHNTALQTDERRASVVAD